MLLNGAPFRSKRIKQFSFIINKTPEQRNQHNATLNYYKIGDKHTETTAKSAKRWK